MKRKDKEKKKQAAEYDDDRKRELHKYVSGLKRYRDKGVPIYVDNHLSGPEDWERLFGTREEGAFYMGDFVETETGELKEIRFDKIHYK